MAQLAGGYWRLRDGTMIIIRSGRAEVVDALDWSFNIIPEQYAPYLSRIAMQIDEDSVPMEMLESLRKEGYIQQSAERWDPYFSQTLRSLDREFLWLLPDCPPQLYEYAVELHSTRREFSADFVQGPCLPETTLRRALMLHERHGNGEVLFIGDDDLVSPVLATLGTKVTVVDIHDHLLQFIRERSNERGTFVDTIHYDIRQPLPASLHHRFDAVITDPVSTVRWLDLFLSRAMVALNHQGVIYLATYKRRENLTRHSIAKMGLVEEAMWRGFSHYYNEYLHYVSSWDSNLFVIARSEYASPVFDAHIELEDNLLEFSAEVNFEYTFDFFGCEPELTWQECLSRLQFELTAFSHSANYNSVISLNETYWSIYASASDLIVYVKLYPSKGYVGVNWHGPDEALDDDKFVTLVSSIFRPTSFYDADQVRYIDYP